MKLKTFTFNPVQENTIVIWDEDSMDGAVVDCGAWTDDERRLLEDFVMQNGIRLKYALQTHTHFDHVLGLGWLKARFEIEPMCHFLDIDTYRGAKDMFRSFLGASAEDTYPAISMHFKDNDEIHIGSTTLLVIHTPGHTPGGVCFYSKADGLLISGDTLFAGSLGRTDLPGGDYRTEIESIVNRLLVLPEQTVVLPGHGPSTTIGRERRNFL